MNYPRLSALALAVSAASLLMASTSFAGHHKAVQENFKGEANYKAEVPPPCPPILLLRDGFYIGAGIGYDSYRINHTNSLALSNGFVQNHSWNTSATGWMGGLFAGYGLYFDWFYMGAEINVSTSAADGSYHYFNNSVPGGLLFSADAEARTSYGIALLPGVKINDSTLFYVRLGWLRTDFKGSVSLIDSATTSFSYSNNNWRNGFQYGVGMESYVAENVSLRGEFTHTAYGNTTRSIAFTDPVSGLGVAASHKFEPSNNEFMLSAIYHFAC